MNKIGLDLNAVGNHEFDEGADELLRMPRIPLSRGHVVREDNRRTLFPPYSVRGSRASRWVSSA
jgi:hypothetical protein